MHGTLDRITVVSRQRRRTHAAKVTVRCEALEERSLLSAFGNPGAIGLRGARAAEMSLFSAGRQDGMFGKGSLGLGGGMMNPTLLLTAPLLDAASGSTTPPSPGVMSSTAVQTALQTLQTDYDNDVTTGAQPTHASVGALEDTLDAIHKGTLTGTTAQTQIQSDQSAILSSMGLTSTQITQLQADATALQNAITSASTTTSASASTTTSASSTTTSGTTSTSTSSTSSSGTASAVQTAMQTLQTDLQNDTPSGGQPSHASVGAVEDDLDAIAKGTLTGAAAVTKVQTDAAAVLSSIGLTATQITQIQTDQQALETAMQENSSSSTSTTSTSSSSASSTATIAETQATLQSVSTYLVGIPGVSSVGMRGMDASSFGGGFGGGSSGGFRGGFSGGFGMGPRGGF